MTSDEVLGLCIAWSAQEPERVGEVALLDAAVPLWLLASEAARGAYGSAPGPARGSDDAPAARPLRLCASRRFGSTTPVSPPSPYTGIASSSSPASSPPPAPLRCPPRGP